jgi:hypothetical protein
LLFISISEKLYFYFDDNEVLRDKIERNDMAGACSSDGGGERRVQGFGTETCGKKNTGETRRRWEDNIKIHLEEVGYGVLTVLGWLRIETDGGHL